METLTQDLNFSQQEAVNYVDGPSLVVAGAGSGKTRVITYKIAHLINLGLPSNQIMALTFTNKAAREMRERIATLVSPDDARRLWCGTFHSIFLRILRIESDKIGFTSRLTIYDTADSKSLIKSILRERGLDEKQYRPSDVLNRISEAKNALVSPMRYMKDAYFIKEDHQRRMPQVGEIYQQYFHRCHAADAMDFDDILLYSNLLFRDFPEVLERYQSRFQYLLVDEYQDTNFAQYSLCKALTGKRGRICAVGDDAQSIYSFRGANIQTILNFQRDYHGCKIFKLEENYRSTQTIVNAANSLIAANQGQIHKTVFSKNDIGDKIQILSNATERDEADAIAEKIRVWHEEEHKFGDVVVLYRTHTQSRAIEESLIRQSIPYTIYGGLSFYQRKEIKDILGYFRYILNPLDEESLRRIINYPARGIGDVTIEKLEDCAQQCGVPFGEVVEHISQYQHIVSISKSVQGKILQFANLIRECREIAQDNDAFVAADKIIGKSMILSEFSERTPENVTREENVAELRNALYEFTQNAQTLDGHPQGNTLQDFMSEVALLTDLDQKQGNEVVDNVTLMTIHASKCLEFRDVIVSGVEEGLLPSIKAFTNEEIEEERRLLYVAITRAKEHCVLSHCSRRFRNGQTTFSKPSRFLNDIDEQYLDRPKEKNLTSFWNFRQNETWNTYEDVSSPRKNERRHLVKLQESPQNAIASTQLPEELSVGTMICHKTFGKGIITRFDGVGDGLKIWVDFEGKERQLLLKFAKYTIEKSL